MSNEAEWKVEKDRLLSLSLDEKRKLYKSPDFVVLDKVDPWSNYLYDLTEFKKIKLNQELNKKIAERVSIYKGDITKLEVDAIVNSGNSMLRVGGGVDEAIHFAAGPFLQQECNSLGGCATGHAKITGGYHLPAKYVIHTVGPQDGSASALQSCYEKCLGYQHKYELKSIAFPCIATGRYRFPKRLAAHIALRTARLFLEKNDELERLIFCTFLPIDIEIYETLMQMYFPVKEWNYNDRAAQIN